MSKSGPLPLHSMASFSLTINYLEILLYLQERDGVFHESGASPIIPVALTVLSCYMLVP